ncbi:MAG: TPM domain-containing protein [Bacteroidia bacterium]|nr:TPM domain-containing protein [Bacteroidia bacterium]
MNKLPSIIILILLLFQSCASDTRTSEQSISDKRVLDKASILKNSEKKQLEKLLQAYADSSGLELGLYTVEKLESEQSIQQLGIQASTEFKAGKAGLNNGATILLSKQDRQAKVEVNYGLEWDIPVVDANDILQEMIPFLAKDQHFEAFELGFQALHDAAKIHKWEVSYPDFGSLTKDLPNSVGKIVSFKSKGLTRGYNSVPIEIQFHPDLFIELKPNDYEGETFLIFSNYMVEMVNAIIYADEAPQIYARVADLEPLQLQLLGIQ